MGASLVMVTAGLAGAAVVAVGQQHSADPAPLVPPHRHFVMTPEATRVPVGPDACFTSEGSLLHVAFSQYHAKVHDGPVTDAFDHSHTPDDIAGARC